MIKRKNYLKDFLYFLTNLDERYAIHIIKNWSKEMDYIIEKNNNIIREKACIDTRL